MAVPVLLTIAYLSGTRRAVSISEKRDETLHSKPHQYGLYVMIWTVGLGVVALLAWNLFEYFLLGHFLKHLAPISVRTAGGEELARWLLDVKALASGNSMLMTPEPATMSASLAFQKWQVNGTFGGWTAVVLSAAAGLLGSTRRITVGLRARPFVENVAKATLGACAAVAVLVTIGIVLSLIFETIRFFSLVSWNEFLFGLHWSPQIALRADQVGSSGAFGAIPVFTGTFLITIVAMFVAVPVGLFSAVYLSEYARPSVRGLVKPLLEILAGIPTVVYGFFAALTVAPWIRGIGTDFGLDVASESALAAGLVMGIMIIPFVSSLSDDVINAVPNTLREGSLGLGATPSETIRRVVLPAALPGIVGSVLLAISRAIGETMIVVMAAGLAANLTANPLEAVTTVTVQIVTLLVGDQEFDSAKTLAAFALGLTLFLVTLVLNVIALRVVRKYREQYE